MFSYLGKLVQAKSLVHLHDRHVSGDILLVGNDQKDDIAESVFIAHPVQVLPGFRDSVTIIRVNYKDNTRSVLVEVAPLTPQAARATRISHGEGQVLVGDTLDIETDGGDGGDNVSELELVEKGSLSGSMQTQDQQAQVLLLCGEQG